MFDDYPDIVTVTQICKMLNLGRNSVYRLLKNGSIHHVQLGRKRIVPKKSVIQFLDTAWYNESQIIGIGLPVSSDHAKGGT